MENDIISIRNKAGILQVRLLEELDISDLNRGFYEMEFEGRPRLEFHQRKETILVTLTGREEDKNIIVVELDLNFPREITAFKAEILGAEEPDTLFETIFDKGDLKWLKRKIYWEELRN